MSSELEIDQLRYRVRSLEAQLAVSQAELEEKRRGFVGLAIALKRQNGVNIPPVSVPPIPGMEKDKQVEEMNDLMTRDDQAWERLRMEYFKVVDELGRSRASLAFAEDSLNKERQRRLHEIEHMRTLLAEKEKELSNYKAVSESNMKKSVELEDKLAKLRSIPTTSGVSSAPSTTRSNSPPPPPAHIFSRNYFSATPTQNNTMASISLSMPPQYSTNVPMFSSPVLVSRQVLPSQHIYRRGSS